MAKTNDQMPVAQFERRGQVAAPIVARYPSVIGGVCEYCGVLDNHQPSKDQYKLCPHYKGAEIRCSYCDPSKDPEHVIEHAKMIVVGHPTQPGVRIAVCDNISCVQAHQKRFRVTNQ